jgi:hypothetical protein
MTTTALTTAQNDMLLKLRKGSCAWLTAKKLEEVLGLLGGWTVAKNTLAYLPAGEAAAVVGLGFAKPNYNDRSQKVSVRSSYSREEPLLEASSFEADDLNAYRDRLVSLIVTEVPGATKKSPATVVTEVGEITTDQNYKSRRLFSFAVQVKIKALRVTAPNGLFYDISDDRLLGSTGRHDFQKFFAWATEHTNLMDGILKLLDLPAHVKKADQPREAAKGQTLGTCAICGRQHVVRGDKVVLHGYQRPGFGYITGDCFGVGYQPYELSPKACEDYAVKMSDYITKEQERVALFRSGTVTEVNIKVGTEYRHGRAVAKLVAIGPEDRRFTARIAELIAQAESHIANATQVREEMEKRVRDWKPGKLIQG